MKSSVGPIVAAAAAFMTFASPSHATLTLTPGGIALGFSISTVVAPVPGGTGVGVLGSTVNPAGQIIFNSSADGTNYRFANADNQTLANAISSTPEQGFPEALVTANGSVWSGGGVLHRLNSDGSLAQAFSTIPATYGMWTDPVNQHIIASTGGSIIDIDVSNVNAPTYRIITNQFTDGLTVSPDGTVAYLNTNAYNISDGSLFASYSVSGADGMGVIVSSNSLNGDVVVSTDGLGTLVLLEPGNNFAQTLIATGGGYGDFANTDPTTGTLLFGSGGSLLRLSCGTGCGVGSVSPPPTDIPEPASLAVLAIGAAGVSQVRRRRA